MAYKRGRPPLADPPVEWKVAVPSSLANKITLILADPMSGGVKYGSRSKLIELLLRNWLKDLITSPDVVGEKSIDNLGMRVDDVDRAE